MQVHWTGHDVRRLVRYRADLIEAEPWATWLRRRGGVAATYAFLQRCPMAPDERAILALLLEHPGGPTEAYARAAAVSRAAYFRKLGHLFTVLAVHLNAWQADPAAQEEIRAASAPDGVTGALPVELTSLHGRAREIAEVTALLRRPSVRLLTLTGPGGIGKTRVALRVAAMGAGDFADGAVCVPLDGVTDPRAVADAIARRLGITGKGMVVRARLTEHLRGRHMLLLLDSFEHLLAAGSFLCELLVAAPHTKLLVTSRAVLGLASACTYVLPPLLVADPADGSTRAGAAGPAVTLFACRAQASLPSFALTEENAATVTAICQRLEGVPLAIELAAAWSALLSPQDLLQRLDQPLRLLTRGARDLPPRQRTLRATLEWSYHLLAPEEQQLFAHMSVFAGSWPLDAAEAVCTGEGAPVIDEPGCPPHTGGGAEDPHPSWLSLAAAPRIWTMSDGGQAPPSAHLLSRMASLLDTSMIAPAGEVGGERRFKMLEMVQAYAGERLRETGEERRHRDRHAHHFLAVAERASPALRGPEQGLWLVRLEQDHTNLRAALRWAGQASAEPDVAVRLAGALGIFWHMAGHIAEGRTWLEAVLARCPRGAGAARAHYWAGAFAVRQGDLPHALAHFEESAHLYRARGDHASLGWLHMQQGLVAVQHGRTTEAQELFTRACTVLREAGDRRGVAYALFRLGAVVPDERAEWRKMLEESVALFTQAGDLWSGARITALMSRGRPRLAE